MLDFCGKTTQKGMMGWRGWPFYPPFFGLRFYPEIGAFRVGSLVLRLKVEGVDVEKWKYPVIFRSLVLEQSGCNRISSGNSFQRLFVLHRSVGIPPLCQLFQVLFCSKVREGDKRVVRVAEGDPKGKHVFIVDDLCNTGKRSFGENMGSQLDWRTWFYLLHNSVQYLHFDIMYV